MPTVLYVYCRNRSHSRIHRRTNKNPLLPKAIYVKMHVLERPFLWHLLPWYNKKR